MADSPKKEHTPPAGLHWGTGVEAPLPKPPQQWGGKVSGAFGDNDAADDGDPVANLFKADETVAAPQISDPLGAEGSRWNTPPQSSLFDNEVKDPSPELLDLAESRAAPTAKDMGTAPTLLGIAAPAPPPEPIEPPMPAGAPPRAIVIPDELPIPPPAAGKPKRRPRKHKAEPPQPQRVEVVEELEYDRKRRKNGAKRKKNVMLAALALVTTAVAAAVAMFLGVVPNPLVQDSVGRIAPAPSAARAKAKAKAKEKAKAKPPATKAKQATAASDKDAREPKVEAQPKAAKTTAKAATAQPEAEAAKPAEKPAPAKPVAEEPRAAQPVAQPPKTTSAAEEPDEQLDARRAVILARNKLADDDAAAAESLMRRVLDADPRDHHAMDVLARALIDQDKGQEAVEFAQQAVNRRKRRAKYRILLGDALLMTGDKVGARAEWKKALELEPANKDVKQRLGL